MPRTMRIIPKRYVEGMEILDYEMESTFVYGYGTLGTDINLRTLDDWRRHWSRWRDVVIPKVIEHRPGLRPFVQYVLGEIPERPVVIPPPMSNGFFKLYVPAANGTGSWHYRYPEPYQEAESKHLYRLGIIDKEELQRHRAWQRTKRETSCGYPLETYPYEQGSFA
jgi:hypothetical protein